MKKKKTIIHRQDLAPEDTAPIKQAGINLVKNPPKPKLRHGMAFDRGQAPVISCVNKSTRPLGVDFKKLIDALQIFVDRYFGPVWGVNCTLQITTSVIPGTWGMVFLDNPDVANAFGYHDLTSSGLPLSKVFMDVVRANHEHVGITASHELAEMLIDPALNLCAIHPNGTVYAYECADAPEAYSFLINQIPMTDFVYPAWFEGFRKPKSTQFDYLKKIDRPFKILKGGYMSVYVNGSWTEIFGDKVSARSGGGKKFRVRADFRKSNHAELTKSKKKTEK